MNKLIVWFLSFTKLGKIVDPIQRFLSGKKAYLAGAALAIPALLTMIQKFSDQGMNYLVAITHQPEFDMFMQGIAVMGLRAAITKAADPTKDPNVANG